MTYLPDASDFQQPFTLERQARFLEALSISGNVRACCRAVAIGPNTAYRWRRASPDFARGWEAALVAARVHAEQVLADRALNGVEEAVFYHGEEVARRRRYSDKLLLAHLARLDAKAGDAALAEAAADFDTVLAQFAATGEFPAGPDASAGAALSAGQAGGTAPAQHPWDDETLPLVERALLYLEAQEGDENGPDDGPEEGALGCP